MLPCSGHFAAAAWALQAFLATAIAQRSDGANQIFFPSSGDQVFNYMDTVNVAYKTTYQNPWMYLFCQSDDSLEGKKKVDPNKYSPS
jgi:hypothetical protein